MILSLPLSLPDATPIGEQHAMQTRAGITYYFYNLEPYDCHPGRRPPRHAAARRQTAGRLQGPPTRPHACLPGLATDRGASSQTLSGARRGRVLRAATEARAHRRRRRAGGQGDQPARLRDERQRLRTATRHPGDHLQREPPRRRYRRSRADAHRERGRSANAPSSGRRSCPQRGRSADPPDSRPPIVLPAWTLRKRLRSPITPPAWTLHRHTKLRPPIAPPATPATSKRPWAARRATSRAARSPAPA